MSFWLYSPCWSLLGLLVLIFSGVHSCYADRRFEINLNKNLARKQPKSYLVDCKAHFFASDLPGTSFTFECLSVLLYIHFGFQRNNNNNFPRENGNFLVSFRNGKHAPRQIQIYLFCLRETLKFYLFFCCCFCWIGNCFVSSSTSLDLNNKTAYFGVYCQCNLATCCLCLDTQVDQKKKCAQCAAGCTGAEGIGRELKTISLDLRCELDWSLFNHRSNFAANLFFMGISRSRAHEQAFDTRRGSIKW